MGIRIAVSALCVVVYVLSFWFDTSLFGYTTSTPFVCRITYMFAHNGLLHLLGNLLAFNLLCRAANRLGIKGGALLAFVAAFVATWVSAYAVPTVGLSGVCFGLVGVLTPRLLNNREFVWSLMLVALLQVVLFCFTSVNVANHAFSFAVALVLSSIGGHNNNRERYERKRTGKECTV